MSNDFSLIVKLAADTAAFDSGLRTAAQRSRQFATEAAAMFNATSTTNKVTCSVGIDPNRSPNP